MREKEFLDWIGMEELEGKRVKLLFDDLGRATAKIGILLKLDSDFARIKTDDTEEVIPRERVLRIEVLS